MSSTSQFILKPLASLRLTVVLLALTMVLVFAGTWAQIDHDVWTVQKRYFHTFFTWIHLQLFLPREPLPATSPWHHVVEFLRPLGFPMPGGYTLIALLLANLLAAHTLRFKYTIRRAGIVLIHGGLILLILGEVVASVFQREGHMVIEEGQTVSYVQDHRRVELAVSDTSRAEHDEVTAIPGSRLARQGTISYPTLPFEIKVERFFHNSVLLDEARARQHGVEFRPEANAGVGTRYTVLEQPRVTGAGPDANRVDTPSAHVTLRTPDGVELGTYLVSIYLAPQDVEVGGKTWRLDLRRERTYKPYALKLLEFRFDRYTGSSVPKNFSSRVHLVDPTRNENREVLIWMNHPLRYAGETFFQADWNKETERGTVLQVVRNPGWLLPYVSCVLVGAGMLVHFGTMLLKYLAKVREMPPAAVPAVHDAKGRNPSRARQTTFSTGPQQYVLKPNRAGVVVPLIVTALCALWLLGAGRPPKHAAPFDFNAFARVPVSYEGRVMPLDTLARVSLRVMSGKSELRTDNGKLPAVRWLADVFARADQATEYKTFRIDHPELKSLLGLKDDEKLFSIADLAPKAPEFMEQVQRAERVAKKDRDLFQRSVLDLWGKVSLFQRLVGFDTLYVAPPTRAGEDWKPFAHAEQEAQAGGRVNPGARAFVGMLGAYKHDQPESFNASVYDYLSYLSTNLKRDARKAAFEVMFNNFEPFVKSIYLYLLVFLLTCAGWLIAPLRPVLTRTALWVLVLTFVFHTLGLAGRVYIQGRPPVTNLYSSAIFIGWAVVAFCIAIERIYKSGLGSLAASVTAFPTLIIAHFLGGSGDTMQMLQAVLDTNIWLATHVVVITLGYAATFLAGIIGCVFVVGSVFTRAFEPVEARKRIGQVMYGVVCFAMLFSFVGTVLGGIWADQSWGRFWGWDPKENGAALIVLWNAIIVHARWGGLIRERGLALLAIFGNAVTAWSWFGTNLMGVGFHSYGFMDSGVFWLGLFVASQLLLIALGAGIPRRRWCSAAANLE